MANTFEQDGETMAFPNNGRGVFIYTKQLSEGDVVEIYLTLNEIMDCTEPEDDFMKFRIDDRGVQFETSARPSSYNILHCQAEDSGGLEVNRTASYWISVDRDASMIKYGKGYLMRETTSRIIEFKDREERRSTDRDVEEFFSPTQSLYVMVFLSTELPQFSGPLIEAEPVFQFKTRPLAGNLPPLVKDSSTVTLFDLDRGEFIFSNDLPTACQDLYNILKGCELEYPENPVIKLSDAMRYSINTEGKYLKGIMEAKMKGPYYTKGHVYIRVTLGPDMRTGPGNPFILEIWPPGSESAIHNHGAACAIIKILFGRMKISIYNKATSPSPSVDSIKPLKMFDAKQGDFTWMDENWYQTHKLENITDDFCATIQSYRYRSDDKIQWPGFDFIKESQESDSLGIFYPKSDTTFRKMREIVLQEYAEYLKGDHCNGTG